MPSCRSRKYTIKENFMALKGNKSDLLQKKLKKVFLSFKNWTAVKRWRNFWICWQWGWGWLHWLSPGCGSCVFPGPGLALSEGGGGEGGPRSGESWFVKRGGGGWGTENPSSPAFLPGAFTAASFLRSSLLGKIIKIQPIQPTQGEHWQPAHAASYSTHL